MDEYRRSRSELRRKKRMGSLVNGLIGLVVLLIIVVGATIFLGDSPKEQAGNQNENESVENEENEEQTEDMSDPEEDEMEKEDGNEEPGDESGQPEKPTTNQKDSNQEIITESDDENIVRTIIDHAWEPIGTVQQGEHVTTFDGVDWDEMVSAIAYATGLDKEQMTIHWLGNNGFNKAVGTVYTKNKANIYRVYLEWVDQKGWKPTKVEELAEILEENKEDTEEEKEGQS